MMNKKRKHTAGCAEGLGLAICLLAACGASGSEAQSAKAADNPFIGAKPGDQIQFGRYEQDNNTENGAEPIDWLVLDTYEGRALVTSVYALDAQPYHDVWDYIDWEKSFIRKWLNEAFFTQAFSEDEQQLIPAVTVANPDNPLYTTEGGNDTEDHIFLLNIQEVKSFFTTYEASILQATEYAKAQGASVDENTGGCWWWLRIAGDTTDNAAFVNVDGVLYDFGNHNFLTGSIRPAFWIDAE